MQTVPFPVDLLDDHLVQSLHVHDLAHVFVMLCLRAYDSNGNLGAIDRADLADLAGTKNTGIYDALMESGALIALPDGTVEIAEYAKWFPPTTAGAQNARCPVRRIIELYHEHLPVLPQARAVSATTEGYIRARWRESPDRQNLEWWVNYFQYIAKKCPFLVGDVEPAFGRPRFMADLQWIMRPTNMEKIINGKYQR